MIKPKKMVIRFSSFSNILVSKLYFATNIRNAYPLKKATLTYQLVYPYMHTFAVDIKQENIICYLCCTNFGS